MHLPPLVHSEQVTIGAQSIMFDQNLTVDSRFSANHVNVNANANANGLRCSRLLGPVASSIALKANVRGSIDGRPEFLGNKGLLVK